MIESNIFEVTRDEYKNFIETIVPECRRVETVILDKFHQAVKVFSKKTGKCFASRVSYIRIDENDDGDKDEPERYYIFELPDADESLPPIPKRKIILEDKDQVQAFINAIKNIKEKQNDGII